MLLVGELQFCQYRAFSDSFKKGIQRPSYNGVSSKCTLQSSLPLCLPANPWSRWHFLPDPFLLFDRFGPEFVANVSARLLNPHLKFHQEELRLAGGRRIIEAQLSFRSIITQATMERHKDHQRRRMRYQRTKYLMNDVLGPPKKSSKLILCVWFAWRTSDWRVSLACLEKEWIQTPFYSVLSHVHVDRCLLCVCRQIWEEN